jgi:hypothetical protein
MAKDIATRTVGVASPPTTPFSEKWLASLRRALGKRDQLPTISVGAWSPAQVAETRKAIEDRLSIFRRALTAAPSERPSIGVELGKLLAAFPNQDPGVTVALKIEAYGEAISDAPLWAIRTARLQVVRGDVGDGRFAPTPPEFARIVNDVMRALRRDLADLEAMAVAEFSLPAPTPKPPPSTHSWEDVAVGAPVVGRFGGPFHKKAPQELNVPIPQPTTETTEEPAP